jgi:hypothetical protein
MLKSDGVEGFRQAPNNRSTMALGRWSLSIAAKLRNPPETAILCFVKVVTARYT